ncbi:MAG: hypothetical protein CSA35_08485 [Dethiosulfovibrio peptidovorans]|nr:MAG: hypothetical protein CSA35_08485 [Dethiosulfovibrio peptidovorans]
MGERVARYSNGDLRGLTWVFLKTGLLGFGGGSAMAPVIYREAVERRGWLNAEAFGDILALSNSLPGPMAPQMAAVIGYRVAGVIGVLLALTAMILPMAAVMVVVTSWVFQSAGSQADRLLLLRRATVAAFPLVAAMVASLAIRMTLRCREIMRPSHTILVFSLSLGLLLLGVNNGSLILAMLVSVAVGAAPWRRSSRVFAWTVVAFFLATHSAWAYFLGFGTSWAGWASLTAVLVAGGLAVRSGWDHQPQGNSVLRPVLRDMGRLWMLVLLLGIPLCSLSPVLRSGTFLFLIVGMVSVGLVTFGGGPAFIPLAMDLLAGPSSSIVLYARERFMQYVALVGALPSPMVTKIAAVSGWDMVRALSGQAPELGGAIGPLFETAPSTGTLWALIGALVMVVAMTLPATTNAVVAFACLDSIKKSPALGATTRFILPLLTAVFLTVWWTFMRESAVTMASLSTQTKISAWCHTVGLFGAFFVAQASGRVPPLVMVVSALTYGFAVL